MTTHNYQLTTKSAQKAIDAILSSWPASASDADILIKDIAVVPLTVGDTQSRMAAVREAAFTYSSDTYIINVVTGALDITQTNVLTVGTEIWTYPSNMFFRQVTL